MTINKSQGQTFNEVGIYLSSPVFSHGQLYTAFSRARSSQNVKIQITESDKQGKLMAKSNRVFTKNCVYKEILEYIHFEYEIENRNYEDFPTYQSQNYKMDIYQDNNSLDLFQIDQNEYYDGCNNKIISDYKNSNQIIPKQVISEYNVDMRTNQAYKQRLINSCGFALDFLINHRAYHNWPTLTNIWYNTTSLQFQTLAQEVCIYLSSFDQRYYNTNNSDLIRESYAYTYNIDRVSWINQQYFPLRTIADGNCCYNSVALAFTGDQKMMPLFRFAALWKLIEYHAQFRAVVMSIGKRQYRSTPLDYRCLLEDYAFSTGFIPSRYPTTRSGMIRIEYPDQYKFIDSSNNIHWGGPAQFYLMSMALNRTIHVIGYNIEDLGRRFVWSSAAETRPQKTINFCSAHFVCLLPKFTSSERYGLFRVPFNYINASDENLRPVTSEKYQNFVVIQNSDFPIYMIDQDI